MLWTVFWLALVFSFHIVMVNLGIFLALYVPYLKRRADKTGDAELDGVARKLMKFYAATYGVAGVYATAFTVFLLSFYPDFLGLAGHITMIPFGLAILMIVLHFFSITGFWYGWDRWSRATHYLFGILLGLSAVLIPFGFRAVFAFLNQPVGLELSGGKLSINVVKAVTGNPTFWPLYIKSLLGAITAGSFAVVGGLAYSYVKSNNEGYRKAVGEALKGLALITMMGLVLMMFVGPWYAFSLLNVPYKFNNVFSSFGFRSGSAMGFDVSWLFAVKMILVFAQFAVIIVSYSYLRNGKVLGSHAKLLLLGGFIALLTVAIGELMNAFSQYPYFIACLGSPSSCGQILSQIPPDQLSQLGNILNLETYNKLATIKSVEILTGLFMIFLVASTFYMLYVILLKREK